MSDNATRDALRRIAETGSDLNRPMKMDFFVAIPSEAMGLEVARRVVPLGFEAEVEKDQDSEGWTCYCTKTIVPSYSAVVDIERELDSIGREFGGHADGFGTFGNVLPS